MSIFPSHIDSDLELPPIEDGVTEISAENINGLRDAVLAIEKNLGTNLEGELASLADRINVSINSDGTINRAALIGIGLVGLPITDEQIAEEAGIKESKLDLNYPTAALNAGIISTQTNVSNLQNTIVGPLKNNFNMHVIGAGNWHDGYQIKISNAGHTVCGLSASTIGDAVNQIDGYLIGGIPSIVPHLEFVPSASQVRHTATNISVDASNFGDILNENDINVCIMNYIAYNAMQ